MPSLVEMNVGSSKRLRLNATHGPTTRTAPAATTATGREPLAPTAASASVRSSGSAEQRREEDQLGARQRGDAAHAARAPSAVREPRVVGAAGT